MLAFDRDRLVVEARVVGLRGADATLPALDRRRLQLLAFAVIAVAGITRAATLRPAEPPVLPLDFVRPLMVLLGAGVVAYVIDRERRLDRLTGWLVEERAVSAARMMRLDEINAILEVSQAANSTAPLDEVLTTIVRAAAAVGGARSSTLDLLIGESLHVAASSGGPPAGTVVPVVGHPAERVARSWEPVVSVGEGGITRVLSVPVRHGTDFLGVLVLETEASKLFTDYDVHTGQFFAEEAAAAIAKAHRADTTRRALADNRSRALVKAGVLSDAAESLRDPISSVVAAARLLRQPRLLDKERLELAGVIERQAERVNQVVEDVIAASDR